MPGVPRLEVSKGVDWSKAFPHGHSKQTKETWLANAQLKLPSRIGWKKNWQTLALFRCCPCKAPTLPHFFLLPLASSPESMTPTQQMRTPVSPLSCSV